MQNDIDSDGLVRGGQGRSGKSLTRDAGLIVDLLKLAAVAVLAGLALHGCADCETLRQGKIIPDGAELRTR